MAVRVLCESRVFQTWWLGRQDYCQCSCSVNVCHQGSQARRGLTGMDDSGKWTGLTGREGSQEWIGLTGTDGAHRNGWGSRARTELTGMDGTQGNRQGSQEQTGLTGLYSLLPLEMGPQGRTQGGSLGRCPWWSWWWSYFQPYFIGSSDPH